MKVAKKQTLLNNMETSFTLSTTQKGEKAILYNKYLYRLKRENQNGIHLYVCTFNCCCHMITLEDTAIIKVNGENHNYDSKLPENVQIVLAELKRRVLFDIEKPIPIVYDQEVKKFVNICLVVGF